MVEQPLCYRGSVIWALSSLGLWPSLDPSTCHHSPCEVRQLLVKFSSSRRKVTKAHQKCGHILKRWHNYGFNEVFATWPITCNGLSSKSVITMGNSIWNLGTPGSLTFQFIPLGVQPGTGPISSPYIMRRTRIRERRQRLPVRVRWSIFDQIKRNKPSLHSKGK